jgi:hypothetical protein
VRVLNLKALTFHLRLRLVVGHLDYQVSDISTELGYELVGRRFGVFNRVVERGRSQKFWDRGCRRLYRGLMS